MKRLRRPLATLLMLSLAAGIGVQIATQDGLLKVRSPIQGAPAAKAGVVANDITTHVDEVATQGMTLRQALEKMRGPSIRRFA